MPSFLDEVLSSASDAITQACNNDPQCIFDYVETGDPEVGMTTLETNQNNNMDQMVTCTYSRSGIILHTNTGTVGQTA